MLIYDKTLELSKLQVGESGPANFIVSTIIEAENLVPCLIEYQGKGREASVSMPCFLFHVFEVKVYFNFITVSLVAHYSRLM
jgi:hypothetical protein